MKARKEKSVVKRRGGETKGREGEITAKIRD